MSSGQSGCWEGWAILKASKLLRAVLILEMIGKFVMLTPNLQIEILFINFTSCYIIGNKVYETAKNHPNIYINCFILKCSYIGQLVCKFLQHYNEQLKIYVILKFYEK